MSHGRLGVFTYYDPKGIVDEYVYYLVRKMAAVTDEQYVIINGTIRNEYREKFLNMENITLLQRDNDGMDIGGYKFAFETLGDAVFKYNEIVFYNQTIYGPVYDVSVLFEKMEKKNVSLWGISRHPGMSDGKPHWFKSNLDYMPAHIQSYFMVVRFDMFRDMRSFMLSMPKIKDYYDAVSYFEVPFTAAMEQLGHTTAALLEPDTKAMESDYVMVNNPERCLVYDKCPFIKRKAFFSDPLINPLIRRNSDRLKLLDAISCNSHYPVSLIVNNLARTVDSGTYERCFSPYTIYNKEWKSTAPCIPDTAFFFLLGGSMDSTVIARISSLTEHPSVKEIYISTDEVSPAVMTLYHSSDKVKLCPAYDNALSFVADAFHNAPPEAENIGIFDARYGNVYVRFSPAGFIESDLKVITDLDFCANLFAARPYLGCISAEKIDIGEYYSYGYVPNKDRNTVLPVFTKLPVADNREMPPMTVYLGNGMYRKEALNGIFAFDGVKFNSSVSQDAVFPYLVLGNGYLPCIALDEDRLASDYAYTKLRADNFKQFTADVAPSFDTATAWLAGVVEHYNENHNDMTLRQAFNARLGLKQKLYIIFHLFFGAPKEQEKKGETDNAG